MILKTGTKSYMKSSLSKNLFFGIILLFALETNRSLLLGLKIQDIYIYFSSLNCVCVFPPFHWIVIVTTFLINIIYLVSLAFRYIYSY